MTEESTPLKETVRGRLIGVLLATAAVTTAFGILALLDVHFGGESSRFPASLGALLFGVIFVILLLWLRRIPSGRRVSILRTGASKVLIYIALACWLLAGLLWYFVLEGIQLRFNTNPLYLAVPMTIYPFLILWGRLTHSTKKVQT